jgi:hypothetical protein
MIPEWPGGTVSRQETMEAAATTPKRALRRKLFIRNPFLLVVYRYLVTIQNSQYFDNTGNTDLSTEEAQV